MGATKMVVPYMVRMRHKKGVLYTVNTIRKKVMLIMKEKISKAVDYIEKHGVVFSVIVTMVSVILSKGFELCAYLFHAGRYDYLGIPKAYITVNFEKSLWGFLAAICIVAFILLIVYFHCLCYDFIIEKNVGFKRIVKVIAISIWVPFAMAILLIVYLYTQISFDEIMAFLHTSPKDFSGGVLCFTFLYYVLIVGMKTMYKNEMKTKDGREGKDSEDGEDDNQLVKGDKKYKLVMIFALLMVIGAVFGVCFSLYDLGKSSMNFTSEISVVIVDDVQYVVVEKYEDNWILKRCLYDGEDIIINFNHYMLMDISENDVWRVQLKGGKTISSCMVDEKEFARIMEDLQ